MLGTCNKHSERNTDVRVIYEGIKCPVCEEITVINAEVDAYIDEEEQMGLKLVDLNVQINDLTKQLEKE